MKTINVPHDICELFARSLQQNSDKLDIIDWQINIEILKKLYNINAKTPQTIRGHVTDSEVRDQVTKILENLGFKNGDGQGWMMYSRAFLPTALHVDIPMDNTKADGYTIIIPLTNSDKIKTVVFKERTNYPILDYWIEKQDWDSREKVNTVSVDYDMSHGWWRRPDITDRMELDGIANWQIGTAFCFRRSQIHGSTNFTHAGFPFKDYILVQTND
jgi:hypothetical protein